MKIKYQGVGETRRRLFVTSSQSAADLSSLQVRGFAVPASTAANGSSQGIAFKAVQYSPARRPGKPKRAIWVPLPNGVV